MASSVVSLTFAFRTIISKQEYFDFCLFTFDLDSKVQVCDATKA